jgi:hypothetical protein
MIEFVKECQGTDEQINDHVLQNLTYFTIYGSHKCGKLELNQPRMKLFNAFYNYNRKLENELNKLSKRYRRIE